MCGRSLAKLQKAKEEFSSLEYEVMIQSVDITDFDALARFTDCVETQYGSIDIWVNNAGSNQIKSLMEYDVNEFRKMTETLFVATFSGCRIAAEHMMKRGRGVILNASSFSALIPNAGRAPYSACKAAVSSLTRSFAAELAPHHIRVISYVPGLIATEISRKNIDKNGKALMSAIPMQRFGTPEDIAKVMVFMASDCAGYVNGVDVEITGGKFCVQNPLYSFEK